MARRYHTLDVFTDRPLSGNPLAVVHDAADLDTTTMQAIAREFNLSETVFILPATGNHRADIRIFTPTGELPFAGHPTVGAAILIASLDGLQPGAETSFRLGEQAGPVPCAIKRRADGRFAATFEAPRLPVAIDRTPDTTQLAGILGLDSRDIGFGAHVPSRFGAPVSFCYVPVRSRAAVDAIRVDVGWFGETFAAIGENHPAIFAYASETADPDASFYARMFAPGLGIAEDPATGSAAAAFAGVLNRFERLPDGRHAFVIEQGFAMGRPSRIELSLITEAREVKQVAIGGGAVILSDGHLAI